MCSAARWPDARPPGDVGPVDRPPTSGVHERRRRWVEGPRPAAVELGRCGRVYAMPNGLLEVIALDAEDARRAVDGGAHRLELVSSMEFSGLCPALETVESVRAAVDLPVRVMLRLREDFTIGGSDGLAAIRATARGLREAGAEEFVVGWLDARGRVDLSALNSARQAWDGLPFTFHKAMDHVADRDEAFEQLRGIPGLDTVLTSGGPFPAGQGIEQLEIEAAREAGRPDGFKLLVGGGLKLADVPALQAAGLRDFHVGSAVRTSGEHRPRTRRALARRRRRLGRGRTPAQPSCGGSGRACSTVSLVTARVSTT
jgi:copper homeostasis protein